MTGRWAGLDCGGEELVRLFMGGVGLVRAVHTRWDEQAFLGEGESLLPVLQEAIPVRSGARRDSCAGACGN